MDLFKLTPILEKIVGQVSYTNNFFPRVIRHSRRAAHLSVQIGKKMGLTESEIIDTYISAIMHDISKKFWPAKMEYTKKSEWTQMECQLQHDHPEMSLELLSKILEKDQRLKDRFNEKYFRVSGGVLFHHESYNGSGYPTGRDSEKTPIEAQTLKLCDSFDSMRSPRIYRSIKNQMMSYKQALGELERLSGIEYHPEIVRLFKKIPKELIENIYSKVSPLAPQEIKEQYGIVVPVQH